MRQRVATGLALLLAACAGEPAPPSLVLISLDTTRPDHLSVYGYGRDSTPNLAALARRALVFEQALTVSENTLVAHASIFTGLFPGAHGTHWKEPGTALAPSYQTLAEDLAAAGYQTAGFTAHGDWLTEAFGMDQGFETFRSGYRPADVVLAEAAGWLAARDPARPFFLFVHLFDAHSDRGGRPYQAPAPFAGRFTGAYAGPLGRWDERSLKGSRFLQAVSDGHVRLSPADIQHLRDQYDEGLAYLDDQVGGFLRETVPQTAWVVLTSDHGEEFGEHGRMLHGSLYDEVVRVPLLLVPPEAQRARVGAPRRLAEPVRVVDLRPTLLALAGLPAPTDCQGADLLAWLEDPSRPGPSGAVPLYHQALRADGFKLLRAAGGPRLFDLRADPGERVDLAADPAQADRLARMQAALDELGRRDEAIRQAHLALAAQVPATRVETDDQHLRELGYVK